MERDGTTADVITKPLLGCLKKYSFDDQCFGNYLTVFACNAASVMLNKKAVFAMQILFLWHWLNHCLGLRIGDVLKKVSGLKHFSYFLQAL